jgi:hypothetical protein
MIMNLVVVLVAIVGRKLARDIKIIHLKNRSEETLEEEKKRRHMESAKEKGALVSVLFYIFYLNIEVMLVIILVFNVAA